MEEAKEVREAVGTFIVVAVDSVEALIHLLSVEPRRTEDSQSMELKKMSLDH